jgi:hypothetical protein
MTGFSIFSIPYVSKACRTPRDERTPFQRVLVGTIDKWLEIEYWWPRHAKKYDVAVFRGQAYYESLCDMRTWVLYDRNGYLVGWYGQDHEGYDFFKTFEEANPGKPRSRMYWLSRLRSPKLPVGNQAEIIADDGAIVGHTTYKNN